MVEPLPGSGSEPPVGDPGQPSPNDAPQDSDLKSQLADLTAAMKKLTADNEIQREENQRLQQMVLTLRDHSGERPGEPVRAPVKGPGRFSDPNTRSEFERMYSVPADAVDVIIDETLSRVERAQREREENLKNAEALKRRFFDKFPDLRDNVPVVKYFADECAQQHPDWNVDQGFAEVAKRSRDYIKSKLSSSSGREEPPGVLPSGSHRSDGGSRLPGSPDNNAPVAVPTQEDEIRAEMESRRTTRNKAI